MPFNTVSFYTSPWEWLVICLKTATACRTITTATETETETTATKKPFKRGSNFVLKGLLIQVFL